MSTSWIKMGTGLKSHPKVVRIASALKADRLRVIGGLWAVWCVFDAHSPDGLLDGYKLTVIDEEIGWKGFGAAMESVGWLVASESGLRVPDYEEHNGPTAKRRASETKRKADARESSGDDRNSSERKEDWKRTRSGQMSASNADKKRAREEKNREEEKEKEKPPATRAPPADAGRIIPDLRAQDLEAEGVDGKVARDWLRIRKAKKAPLTPTAWAALKREAVVAGMTPAQAVKHAAESNWQGFKAAWLQPNGAGRGGVMVEAAWEGAR